MSKIKESSKVPVVASVENVVAVIVGVMVFHEKVGIGNLAGIVLVLGAGGLATMWEAVFADVGVALLAILNAVRIQRMKF